jgi:hypothetical protein
MNWSSTQEVDPRNGRPLGNRSDQLPWPIKSPSPRADPLQVARSHERLQIPERRPVRDSAGGHMVVGRVPPGGDDPLTEFLEAGRQGLSGGRRRDFLVARVR